MIYAELKQEGRMALQKAMQTVKKSKQYRRYKAIDLSSQGYDVPKIAEILDYAEATVRRLIHTVNESGVDALAPTYGKGRPAVLDWTKEQWEDLLAQAPAHLSKLETGAQNWTQQLVCQYLQEYHGLTVSQRTISSAIKRVGLNWRRSKLRVHSPDPLYVVKRQRVETLKSLAKQGQLSSEASSYPRSDRPPKPGRLVYFDSTDLHWCPDLGNGYMPVSEQMKVDSPGVDNSWLALFGSLEFPTGNGFYTIHNRKRTLEVGAHLQLLIDIDPDAFWFVVLDNATAHTTQYILDFAQRHQDRLELVFLPTYSPHLNLIERLWRLMRSQVTRNRFLDSLLAVAEAVVDWLDRLSFAQFCSLIGIDEADLSFVDKPFF